MQLLFPKPNQYPPSLHILTKHFANMKKLEITKFCLSCIVKIPCESTACGRVGESHFALLPFENQFSDICSGKFKGT